MGVKKKSGTFYQSIEAVKHQDFTGNEGHDVGLVKLATHVTIHQTDEHYLVNIICLPEKTMIFEKNEPVIMSGWGNQGDRLQIGTLLLGRYKQSDHTVLVVLPGMYNTYGCKVISDYQSMIFY